MKISFKFLLGLLLMVWMNSALAVAPDELVAV